MRMLSLCVALLSLFVSSIAQAEDSKLIEIKCYVALLGGGETIHFAKVNAKNKTYNINDVAKLKIPVTGKKKKQEIYKIYECVETGSDFTSAKAKSLESSMVW